MPKTAIREESYEWDLLIKSDDVKRTTTTTTTITKNLLKELFM